MSEREKEFFNELAARWDDLRAPDAAKIAALVELAGVSAGEKVLDVGCGTGVLAPFLKAAVGDAGRVTAIDFAATMVARAREKHGHLAGVEFAAEDIWRHAPAAPYDRIICFNFFPHAGDKAGFAARMRTLLKEGGVLVIMHDMSRAAVNAIHAGSKVVSEDRLPEGMAVAALLTAAGYDVDTVLDGTDRYLVRAAKAGRP